MVRLIYCIVLLFILSGMYFVTRQSSEGLFEFLIQVGGAGIILAGITMLLMKKRDLNFFGSATFFIMLIIGIVRIIFGSFN